MFRPVARSIRRPRWFAMVALSFLLANGGWAASSPELRLVVLGPEFARFWSAAQDQTPERQRQLWDTIIEAPHQQFYLDFVWEQRDLPKWRERKRRALDRMFAQLPELYPAMMANFAHFPETMREQAARFRRSFPDATFPFQIYAAPVGVFNGRGSEGGHSTVNGEPVLAFGIDLITERHDDPGVLYTHELFHMYHARAAGIDETVFAERGHLTLPLWMEGFATYVSGLLNPAAAPGVLLMDPALGRLPDSEMQPLARAFLAVADEKAVDPHRDTFAKWFTQGATLRPGLPDRCGYWLGWQVVRHLAKTHRLDEMVHWRPDESHQHVLEALHELAREPVSTTGRVPEP